MSQSIKTGSIDWSQHIKGGAGYDRTPLPEYGGLPREIDKNELIDVLDALGRTGAERIKVTARNFEAVCTDLDIKDATGLLADVRGKRVLTCGEGASNFAQTLERAGADCVAVDRVYRTPKDRITQDYIIVTETAAESAFRFRLLTADEMMARLPKRIEGADLDKLPFATGSFDRVFIPNVLYWYLDVRPDPNWDGRRNGIQPKPYAHAMGRPSEVEAHGEAMVREALRVTADGGVVHFNLAKRWLRNDVAKRLETWPSVKAVECVGIDVLKITVQR